MKTAVRFTEMLRASIGEWLAMRQPAVRARLLAMVNDDSPLTIAPLEAMRAAA